MSYSRNFGMRSFENVVRKARFKTPATGQPFKIGTAVVVDPDNEGRMKAVTTATAPTALSGLVVFEHIQFQGVDTTLVTNHDTPFDLVPQNRHAQIMSGKGAKVWFKNTADAVLYDGRVRSGSTMVAGLGGATPSLEVGDYLTPSADGWAAGTATNGWLQVEQVNHAAGLVECRVTF